MPPRSVSLDIGQDSGKIHIITERMSKGALLDLLRKDDDHIMTFKDLMNMAIQVGPCVVSAFRCNPIKMGSLFSKRKDETKPAKSTKVWTRPWKKQPRNAGSTQTLNTDSVGVSPNPNPDANCAPDVTRSLPCLYCIKPPEVPPHSSVQSQNGRQQENSINAQSKTAVSMSPPPRSSAGPPRSSAGPYLLPDNDTYSQLEDTESPEVQTQSSEKTQTKLPPVSERHPAIDNKTESKSKIYDSIVHPLPRTPSQGPNKETANQRETAPDSEQAVGEDRNGKSDTGTISSFKNGDVIQIIGERCFFKGMDRKAAEAKLQAPDIELGTYLLRPSEEGDYALSLRCESELYELDIRHYKVRVIEKGICYIDADSITKPFSNIPELIKHYEENSGLRCKLKKPLSHDDPMIDLAVKYEDLELGEKLGSGNFATVHAGTLHGIKQVAVKSLKIGGTMTVDEFRMEAETMHKLRHPNLVSLLAISEDCGKILIITERMSKGALLDLLRKDDAHTIVFRDLMDMAIQVVEGMCFLESKSFVHRDLRAANVLVGEGNVTKIADFGLTRLLDNYYEHEDYYQNKKGSVFPYKWTAPESVKKQKFTVKSDVWSLGVLLYEMVTYGDEPYAAMSNREVLDWVEAGNRPEKPKKYHCPFALYNIMKQCWMMNSNDRPTFGYIKENLVEIKTNA